MKRRCGWIPGPAATPERLVWARRDVSTTQCPKSYVTAGSLEWIEAYFAWKTLGVVEGTMTARQVDAFCVLENELRKETRHGQEGS
jgi:hypothetical protein